MKLRSFILINCIILLLILLVDGMWLIKVEGINSIPKSYNKPKSEGTNNNTNKMSNIVYENKDNPVNIIIMGLDDEEVRSDVILLMNYSPKDNRLNIISIARDTMTEINNRRVKINSLIGINGEKLVAEKVEELTGLPVHYYVTLNFEGFRNIIDTLDGVEVDVPFNMNYDDPEQGLHIHLKKGMQLLDGDKAEQFVRYRKGNRTGEGYTFGDLGRIKTQQKFIKALLEQKARFKYISKVDEIFLILKKYMNTNIEIGDINYYLNDLVKLKSCKIEAYTLPGDSKIVKNVWYFICDEQKAKELIDKNFFK
jgi:polyisoprenyl-teichoic acid--peptidoglycan teichoic acid transferase